MIRKSIVCLILTAALASLAGAAAAPGATSAPVVVRMTDGLQFRPARVTVKKGRTIVWRNVGSVAHTITTKRSLATRASDAVVPKGAKVWNSGFIGGGKTYRRTLLVPGTYRYFCIPHEAARMVGTIVVTR
ncbi:MAG: cupredoxin domain-containing protein [Gaiellaceae bacterium]